MWTVQLTKCFEPPEAEVYTQRVQPLLCVLSSENGKNLREKHGGSSLAAKLHGVPCFFLKFLPFSTKDDVTVF